MQFHSDPERTEVLHGAENTTRAVIQFFNSASIVSACADALSPSIAIGVEPIKKCYDDLKSRNAKIRWLTEINNENLQYCKALMGYAEVRHLDGIKGNFGVSDNAYIATATVNEAQAIPELIYSNVKSLIEQNKYVFDTLWSNAIPAEDRIREIEQGIVRAEIRAVKNPMEILQQTAFMVKQSKRYSVCSVADGLLYANNHSFDTFKEILQKYSEENHEGIRWITSIGHDCDPKILQVIKNFLNLGMQIRHVSSIPPMSFGVSQNEMGVTVESMQGGSLNTSAIFSTEPAFIQQFAAIFEELWGKGIEAESRIKEIESEATTFIDIVQNPLEIQKKYRSLASSAREQILLFLPSATAYSREEKIGIFEALREAGKRGVEIKILLPVLDKIDAQIQEKIDALKGFQIRKMRTTAHTQARSKILLVDKKEYLMIEIKDDSKETFSEAVGSAIYSNSRSTVLSYITMFESLWAQSELYEKLDAHDRMQREFINIAAHELRTPTQSILGYSELLENEIEKEESKEMLKGLSRNAHRLQGLISDVLDVARIEGGAMYLQRSEADIEAIIRAALSDAESQAKVIGSTAELTYESTVNKDTILPIEINLDKERILQVLANLLSNALKFTKEGKIEINAERQGQSIVIKVKDSGTGIDPEIFPKLFEKFASKSDKGTGLGLFISKNIIEAHGGRIWAENNIDKGATIAFSLPLKRD